eukprot:92548_1
MAQYHFQCMMYELVKIQNEMNYLHAHKQQSIAISNNTMSMHSSPPMTRQMQYLKWERYFIMNHKQKEILSNKFTEIKQSLIKYATITIVDELKEFGVCNCYCY